MVNLDVCPGGRVRGLGVVGRHVQRLLVQMLRYGVGPAAGRVLWPHVIQPQGLETIQDGLCPVIEVIGATKSYIQVTCRQYPMLVRAVIVTDERRQVRDDVVSGGVGIYPVSNCGWVRAEPAGVHRSCYERLRACRGNHLGDFYGADAAYGHILEAFRVDPGRAYPPEPFDPDAVGQLHHHGPPIIVLIAGSGVILEPWRVGAQLHSV